MSPSSSTIVTPFGSCTAPTPQSSPTPSRMLSIVIPPQFSSLPSDSMASLASAVASSIWHSVPDQPLQQLEQAHARGQPLFSGAVSSPAQSPTPPASPSGLVFPPHGFQQSAVFGAKVDGDRRTVDASVMSPCSHQLNTQAEDAFTTGVQVVRTMLAATQLSPSVVLVATLYVARLRTLVRHAVQAAGSELRVLTVALMLAAKWMEDHTYANASWALVSGMSTRDLGTMEFEFLSLLQWDLSVSTVQFAAWLSTLTTAATLVFSPSLSLAASSTATPGPPSGTILPANKVSRDEGWSVSPLPSEIVLPGAFNTSPLVPDAHLTMALASTSATAVSSKRSRTSSSKSLRLRKASSVVMQVLAASQSHFFQAAHETATVLATQYPTSSLSMPMELMYPHQQQHVAVQHPQAVSSAFFGDQFPMAAGSDASITQVRYHPYHMPSPVKVDAAPHGGTWMHNVVIAGQPHSHPQVIVPSQSIAVPSQQPQRQLQQSYAYSAPPSNWIPAHQY